MAAFQSSPQSSPQATFPHSTSAASRLLSHPSQSAAPALQVSRHDYNITSRSNDESSATEENHEYTDEEMAQLNVETASSRSSVSSLPASIAPSSIVSPPDGITPTKNNRLHDLDVDSLSNNANRRKWRESPFRSPSSVRSMQMRDEDNLIPLHRKKTSRTSRNLSTFSAHSSGSISQTKPHYSKHSLLSPKTAKVKKEFPLVLLHCSLLPPALPIKTRTSDAALLRAVLPEEYWRRWESLADRITNDLEIQSRGVLIPHPKADYELLEERLLESLELAKPKLRSGHYYGNENVDDVEDSESDAEIGTQGIKCQDCGKRIVEGIYPDRKWEVKVYAANGLMRAGAWSAAWNEMEKVDVEVSMCLPEEVKKEVYERCLHLGFGNDMEADEMPGYETVEQDDVESRRREIYGTSRRDPQENVDGFTEINNPYNGVHQDPTPPQHQYQQQHHVSASTIEFKQFFINYIKALAQDKRNTVIAVLSLAVLFFAFGSSTSPRPEIDQIIMPDNVLVPSSETVQRCTVSPMTSMAPLTVVPLLTSALTPGDPLTLTECEEARKPTVIAAAPLKASVPHEKEEFINEVG